MPDYIDFILRLTLFATAHSLLASKRIKLPAYNSSSFLHHSYRLLYNLLSLIVFGWAMSAYRHSPVIYFAPGIWSLLMYLLQILLAAALIRCVQQTGSADFLGIRQWQGNESAEHLTTDGFYAYVRHPLYLISIMFLLLNPVMTLQWLILTVFSTLYFIVGAIIEERRLIETFGDAYRDYRDKVPFIIPVKRRKVSR